MRLVNKAVNQYPGVDKKKKCGKIGVTKCTEEGFTFFLPEPGDKNTEYRKKGEQIQCKPYKNNDLLKG